jgi:hypothetical protein
VTEALPPEFQLPNRVRGRGQLVRVELMDANNFAVDQKVVVTSCYIENCRIGLAAMIRAIGPGLQSVGRKIAQMFKPPGGVARAPDLRRDVSSELHLANAEARPLAGGS